MLRRLRSMCCIAPGVRSIRQKMEVMIRGAQDSICAAIEEVDGGGKFRTDAWQRAEGGGGISKVMQVGRAGRQCSAVCWLAVQRVGWPCGGWQGNAEHSVLPSTFVNGGMFV